ncbi:MAG TPA: EAL domain-containing protein [Acidimicrobiales bacterium]|nr:EAL domain-containing protein [Acidimicrobiales bacterium]
MSTVKVLVASADTQHMAEARLGPVRTAPAFARPGALDELPEAWRQLALVSDLTNVVVWELEVPGTGVTWHAPFVRLLKSQPNGGRYRVPPGPGGRVVRLEDLGDAVLAPVVETVQAGIAWENYELVQEFEAPGGSTHRVLVRAVSVPDPQVSRFLGIIADVSEPDDVPWITADVGERLQLLVEHSPDGIIVHQDGLVVYTNPAAVRMVGLSSPGEALGRPITAFLSQSDLAATIARLAQLKDPGDVVKGFEATLLRRDGGTLPVEVASARTSWNGKPAFQAIMRDISERKLAEEQAQARAAIERRHAAAVAALEEGVIVIDRDGAVVAENDSAVRILGSRLRDGRGDAIFTGGRAAQREGGAPFPPHELPLARALSAAEASTNVMIGVTDDAGNDQWLSVSSRPIGGRDTEGDAGSNGSEGGDGSDDNAAVVCSVSDITDRKRLVDRLAWEARNDPLTGLANRSGFLAALHDAIHDAHPSELKGFVLFFFDLDRFKLVNDSLGHAVGDEVLLAMADRLRSSMPTAISLSRLHGDEFAALEPGVNDTDSALQRAEELRTVLSRPVRLSTGRTLAVTPSIGLVRLVDVGNDAAEVLQDADMAMLQAKTRGRGRVAIFDAGLREEVGSRLELEHDLRAAVDNGELRLEYQPLASLSNGRVLGLEALVRWEHPRRGLLLPGRFVRLAEESELIVALGQWVLEAGCAQMARWRAMYPEAADSFLAVNVSPRQLDGQQLLPALRNALDKSGLPAGALMLEITESGLVSEDGHIHTMLNELREFGVRLSIDDFGTGYSSLSLLKRLPVSYLKVDRSFVMGLGTDAEDERIVAAITELGHGLGLRVVAEGVENRQQRHVARQLGCDLYQGYLLAEPRRPRDIPQFWRPRSAQPAKAAG